jgi:hypothetical protein
LLSNVDPTDIIGWLFLKDKDIGERHRGKLPFLLGCECPEPAILSPTIDPPDLIGWLFLMDQDNGERSASSASPKSATLHPRLDPSDLIGLLFLKDQDDGERHHFQITDPADLTCRSYQNDQNNGERLSLSPPVIVRQIQENGERRHRVFECDYSSDERGMPNILPNKYKCAQSAVSLGHTVKATAVISMSLFRAVPHQGHLEWVKRIVVYSSNMRHDVNCTCPNENDFLPYGTSYHDWMDAV